AHPPVPRRPVPLPPAGPAPAQATHAPHRTHANPFVRPPPIANDRERGTFLGDGERGVNSQESSRIGQTSGPVSLKHPNDPGFSGGSHAAVTGKTLRSTAHRPRTSGV